MKTLIIYNSHHGTTKKYATEIFEFIQDKEGDVTILSIDEFSGTDINEYDNILLGTWTQGLFLFAQRPDKKWNRFAKSFPQILEKKVALFTTYKLATGSFYKNLAKSINLSMENILFTLKSKNGEMSMNDLEIIKQSLMN